MNKSTEITIIINGVNDETPELVTKSYKHGTLKSFLIMEAITSNKKTGVIFHAEMPNGENVLFNTTSAIFQGLASALKGAEQRFAEGTQTKEMSPLEVCNEVIQLNKDNMNINQISDGYNTFGELYNLLEEVKSALYTDLTFPDSLILYDKIEKLLNK